MNLSIETRHHSDRAILHLLVFLYHLDIRSSILGQETREGFVERMKGPGGD